MSKQTNTSSAAYSILAFRFKGRKGAEEAMKTIKSSSALDGYKAAAQATVEQDESRFSRRLAARRHPTDGDCDR